MEVSVSLTSSFFPPPCPCLSSDLNSREEESHQPVHVINVDIQDNHEEATLGAFLICELCQCVSVSFQSAMTLLCGSSVIE